MDKLTMGQKIKALREAKGLTLEQVGDAVGVGKSTVRKWETGLIANMKRDKIAALSTVLETTPAYLMDWEEDDKPISGLNAINPSDLGEMVRIPIFGSVRAGNGGFAQEELEGYELVPASMLRGNMKEYFYLRTSGDSMEPEIKDGDLVLIHKQESVDNGTLAVVLVDGEEGVVKHVYHSGPNVNPKKPETYWIELRSVNAYYPPRRFVGEDVLSVSVVGRVVGHTRWYA